MILGSSGSLGCQRNRQLAVTPGPLSTDGASLVRARGAGGEPFEVGSSSNEGREQREQKGREGKSSKSALPLTPPHSLSSHFN